jgi:transcriptional regulator with XRE-family HTH domain
MAGNPVTELDRALGAWLHDYRTTHEMQQDDVAEAMNATSKEVSSPAKWSQATVSKVESGKRAVYSHELLALARWSGLSVDTLLSSAYPRRS